MEREAEIGRPGPAWDDVDRQDGDAELEALLARLPPCPAVPGSDEEALAADARARAQLSAGRGVSGDDVAAWASRLGTPDERPMPTEWLP